MSALLKTTLTLAILSALTGCGGGDGPATRGSPTAAITANVAAITQSGSKYNAPLNGVVTLSGLASTDSGSTITSYSWALISKPIGSTVTIAGATTATASFTPDIVGDYVVTLTVTDAAGITSKENITISGTTAIPVINVTKNVVFNGPSTTTPSQAINSNTIVTLDASSSTDPAGQPLTITWTILQKPASSTSTLSINGQQASFTADVLGVYQVRARATNTDGTYSDVIEVFDVNQLAPTAVVSANATPASGSGSINAGTNYNVVLTSGINIPFFPNFGNTTTTWLLTSKPTNSAVSLSAQSGNVVNLVPDVAGDYIVTSTVTDNATNAATNYVMTVHVAQAPTPIINGTGYPAAVASAPSFVSGAGTPVTLRGSSSFSNTGSLTYAWQLLSTPQGSNVATTLPATANVTFTPDVGGVYVAQLTVSDSTGLSTSQNITINVGGHAPIALLAQTQAGVLLGNSVNDSAAASYSPDGSPLTYSWSIDSRPAGSTATIANPTASTLSFTPDVAGSYTATLTVSAGNFSSTAQVQINAITASSGTLPLTYAPQISRYSKSLDKAIIISANPNVLHIIDPVADTDVSVALSNTVKDLSISPDGTKAAVLYEGLVSLVDLTTATLLNSYPTGGSHTAVFLNNAGQVYLTGQTGGQWVTPSFRLLDANTGAIIQDYNNNTSVYGTTLGAYADTKNKLFFVSLGISPQDIYNLNLTAGTGLIASTTNSPYHGTYNTGAPLWLSADQNTLFTSSGTYFQTSDLTYQGTLGLTSTMLAMANSTTANELDVLQNAVPGFYQQTTTYPNSYKRYTGSLLLPSTDGQLPLLANQQAYGLNIFYSSTDKHVIVAQTGGNLSTSTGLQYYVIVR